MIEDMDAVAAAAAELEALTDPDRRHAAIDEAFADFGPEGRWRFAPEAERRKAREAIEAAHDARAGEALFAAHEAVRRAAPEIEAAIASAEELPDPVQAFTATYRLHGHTAEQALAVLQLHEAQVFRYERECRDAPPSVVLGRYEDAIARGDVDFARFIEARYRRGWIGPDVVDDSEIGRVQQLTRRIKKAREARVPQSVRDAAETVDRVRQVVAKVEAAGVRPRRPKGV